MDLGKVVAALKEGQEIKASKIQAYKHSLALATDCLTKKIYCNAEVVYGSILADLQNEQIKESLHLNDLELFSLHVCFAYASIGTNHKSESALHILNSIDKPIKLPLIPYLKAFIHIANDRFSSAHGDLEYCNKLITKGYNFKENEILNGDIVPEINTDYLRIKLNGLQFSYEFLVKGDPNPALKHCYIDNWLQLGQIRETDFAKFIPSKPNAQPAKSKQGKSKLSVAIQTLPPPKLITAAVQTTDKEVCAQIFNAVIDIRNKVNSLQSKKDNELKQLHSKNQELTGKLLAREEKREERASEFEFLKSQLLELQKKHDESQKQVRLLQNLLSEQLSHKYVMQKTLYKMFEEKCEFKMDYLTDIRRNSHLMSLNNSSISLAEECGCEIEMWRKSLDTVVGEKNRFDVFYKSINELVASRNYSLIKIHDWPGIPLLPIDVQDIIHRNFKLMIQQGTRQRNNAQYNPYAQYNSLFDKYPHHTSYNGFWSNNNNMQGRDAMTYHPSPSQIAPNENPPQEDATAHSVSENELLQFLQSHCVGRDTNELRQALAKVYKENKGALVTMPNGLLLKQVRKLLKKKKTLQKNGWQNDHSENTCVICFEEIDWTNSHSLPCQHEFHANCIKEWLKVQSACPVCRVSTAIDTDFPPLL